MNNILPSIMAVTYCHLSPPTIGRCHVMWMCFAAAQLIFIKTHDQDDIK